MIAILLAEAEDNRYITLCLDEPNKCMHPAQVKRLRETMLQKVKKGCSIIVSTHSRDMISIDTWKHVHYFKRHTCEGGPRANLAFTRVPFDDPRYQDSFTRGSNPFRDALFARRCLFVEGISDYRFFNVLLEECHDQNPILKDITIIELTTATKCKLVHNVCQKSQIPHVIWLDGDQRKDYKNQNNSYFWKTPNDLEDTINQYLEPKKRVTKKGDRDVKDIAIEDLRVIVKEIICKGKTKKEDEIQSCINVLVEPKNFKIKQEEPKKSKIEQATGKRKGSRKNESSSSKKARWEGGQSSR